MNVRFLSVLSGVLASVIVHILLTHKQFPSSWGQGVGGGHVSCKGSVAMVGSAYKSCVDYAAFYRALQARKALMAEYKDHIIRMMADLNW